MYIKNFKIEKVVKILLIKLILLIKKCKSHKITIEELFKNGLLVPWEN
jgi:hypothetical protein